MTNIFFISDTHFGHANICKFTRDDGTPLRPWDDIDQMDSDFISKWNKKVSKTDLVYHLGDVVMNRKHINIVAALNGRKRLVLGNHDTCTPEEYAKYFERVYGAYKFEDMWLTHIPIHEDSIFPRTNINIHGHLHAKQVPSSAYFNVSVELIDYEPIALEELRLKIGINRDKFPIDTVQKSVKMLANSQEL
jgi:calcineurin-like phosphoesterase family protein